MAISFSELYLNENPEFAVKYEKDLLKGVVPDHRGKTSPRRKSGMKDTLQNIRR